MRLTEKTIKFAPPSEGLRKLFDGGGLYLLITPTGGKYWRFRYRYAGKNCTMSLGAYPLISLKEARQLHRQARSLLYQCTDPQEDKRQKRRHKARQITFEQLAREWYEHRKPLWKNGKHAQQVINTLEQYAFPHIGQQAVDTIPATDIFTLLSNLGDKPETASRVKQRITAVFDFAIQTGRATVNPAASAPRIIRSAEKRVKHHPALPAAEIGVFLRHLENYPSRKTALLLRLLVLTLARSGEIRFGQWSELHGNKWHIPAERMKMGIAHVVPLSDWALSTLEELRSLNGHSSPYFAAGNRKQPLSDMTLSKAMKSMGYAGRAVPHGFRAMGSSILNESGLWNPDAIERQLAHRESNKVRAAYNRAEYLEERHRMMQWYAQHLAEKWNRDGKA